MDEPIHDLVYIVVPISLILSFSALIPFQRYTGLGRDKAYFTLFASVVIGDIHSYLNLPRLEALMRSDLRPTLAPLEVEFRLVAAALIGPLLIAFVLRLWGRWIGGRSTPEERLPDAAGIQAWFSSSNITVALLLVLCAWLGQDVPPILTGGILAALLAAQPLLGLGGATPAPAGGPGLASVPRPPADDLSAEREKILSMLEAGKLTPEESAELLQALGESSRRPAPEPIALTSHQRLMLIGAAIVALGFFLPWFTINPGREATRLMGQMQSNIRSNFGSDREAINLLSMGVPQWSTDSVSISGGDIRRGLGWATLALALTAALLPYVATTLDERTAQTIRFLCLGLGAFIVLYLVSQNIRFVGIGLIIALAGYALEIAGALRERWAITA